MAWWLRQRVRFFSNFGLPDSFGSGAKDDAAAEELALRDAAAAAAASAEVCWMQLL